MHKIIRFFRRVFRGEDILLVPQTKKQWDSQFAAGIWDRLLEGQPNTGEIARRIGEYAERKGGTIRVLDVGCGNGGLARLIVGNPRIEYVGTDISSSAIARAREAAPAGTFIEGSAAYPPERAGTFDIIVFNEILYYLDPETVLANYRSCADPGTEVHISIVRSWRSRFLWRRIRHFVRISRFTAIAGYDKNRWDIATGAFI